MNRTSIPVSNWIRRAAILAVAGVVAVAMPSRVQAVDIVTASGLPKMESLDQARELLGLSAEQEDAIMRILASAKEEAGPLEQTVREQEAAFARTMRDVAVSPDDAEKALAKLLDAEAAVKRVQLKAMIDLRKKLTAEQLKKLAALSAQQNPGTVPPELMAKVERLKKALESLGTTPTPAMKERGEAVSALLKEGKVDEAEKALDKLTADSGVAEFEAGPAAAVDYTKYATGDTEIPALQARFEAVSEKAKEVVSLPLLRDLLQTKDAFENAKANQDAVLVGRILTYAEQRLGIK